MSIPNRGPAALENVPGLRGVPFFWVIFYCIFVQFGKMTHLVNLKMCWGSSPGCPGGCGAPGKKCLSWLTSYSIKRELLNFEFLQNFKHFFFSTERVKKNLSNSKITPLEIIFRSQCIYLKVNLKLKLPGHCRSLNKLLDRLAHLCHFLDEKKS